MAKRKTKSKKAKKKPAKPRTKKFFDSLMGKYSWCVGGAVLKKDVLLLYKKGKETEMMGEIDPQKLAAEANSYAGKNAKLLYATADQKNLEGFFNSQRILGTCNGIKVFGKEKIIEMVEGAHHASAGK